MTMPINDMVQILYLLEGMDENATKQALKEMYPHWNIQ